MATQNFFYLTISYMGITNWIKKGYNNIKSFVEKGARLRDSMKSFVRKGIGLAIKPTTLLPGEKHGVLLLKDDSLTRANYMGPGTNLGVRIPRRDKGLTPVDMIAKAHDLRYALGKTEKDARIADQKMLNAVKRISGAGKDAPFNVWQANLIKIKKYLGIPTKWITSIGGADKAMIATFTRELRKLERMGY
jgi:hypothetical protein